jgi:hypothetical protein
MGMQALSLMEQAVACVEHAMQLESGTIYIGIYIEYPYIYPFSPYSSCQGNITLYCLRTTTLSKL